jgi:hypothetical protein
MPIHVIQHEYPDLGYDVVPTVNGLDLALPSIAPNICGQSPAIPAATFTINPASGGNYTVYISPAGYCLTITRPDGSVENPPQVFDHTGSAYWCCAFQLSGDETDLASVDIYVLKAVMA